LSSILRDVSVINSDKTIINIVLMNIYEQQEEGEVKGDSTNNNYDTLLNWFTFEHDSTECSFKLIRKRRLNCKNKVPDYVSLETTGEAILITGNNNIQFDYDSQQQQQQQQQKQQNETEMETITETKQDNIEIDNPMFALDQQLEECDGILRSTETSATINENDNTFLRRYDGNSHSVTDKAYINDNKFLFEMKLGPNEAAALCLRWDVDGILWQPHSIQQNKQWLTHEHTFLGN
jgi:hypothetical protein